MYTTPRHRRAVYDPYLATNPPLYTPLAKKLADYHPLTPSRRVVRQRVSNYEPTGQKSLAMGGCRDWRVCIGRESGGFELQEVRFGSNKGQDCANMACY